MDKEIKKKLIMGIYGLKNTAFAIQEYCYCNYDRSESEKGDICNTCLKEINMLCDMVIRKSEKIKNIIRGLI